MKSLLNSIKFVPIFVLVGCLSFIFLAKKGYSQGFNNNEWIFGYCDSGATNSYLSFGKGEEPVVRELPRSIVIGSETTNIDNNAVVIDPITGQILFYTNGVLVYNYDDLQIQGAPNGIAGISEGTRQAVAIAALNYDPNGEKLFYIFYRTPSGQLQYAVVDMNASGGATGNQPPLGAVTALNQPLGTASGALAVVKTPGSPNYLVSYDGGNLVVRRIEPTQGDFTETDRISLGFTPKAIIFKESTQELILIPSDPGGDIVLIGLNTSDGSLGTPRTVEQSGGSDPIEGADLSPDGSFLYFSRGNQLFRIPTNDLTATPEEIPLPDARHKIYDIRIGPDGRLYYIYEEVPGGPQLIGRVNNPNEEDLNEVQVEADPFNGVDFCGTVFPQFAPNMDIEPEVDFTWEPEEPCANNPIQLTSSILPENFRPVSFEWTFDPPLTDEDGEPIDIDFNQEHFLVPQEAASGENITVTLTVTFADGTEKRVPKTINLLPNDLQANFNPQDTTVCEQCFDIGPLLQVSQGQGGEGPSTGGGQNYEYFWSNLRDQGWTTNKNNEICRPGLYWALVREQGSSCYAYAEIRVRMWDVEDQSNNVWLFGNGAGLDFNPDPASPDGPIPRAVRHPQNIPAGTTTISDETGQVLFYTDGQSVWDLNGDLMENGDNIGGSNQSSQSVLAIPIPQNQTMYYLFTTQRAADGSNQVKFSLVDIKAENPTGVGNVVTKDNFLFSPSTEHSAALAAGGTSWALFHELGNNTFRAYPITVFGIGAPVFSSVGSNHGFGSGVGSMKFSPDGSKVAVTISEGACSKLEIFDFDTETGRMTEYALLDLGCNNEDIYGLEFSPDGSRVFVSYKGGNGKLEEFLIQAPENNSDEENPDLSCGQCFQGATTREARETCILNSPIRNTLSTSGPFGAIQIGPNGLIYVAVPGGTVVPFIAAGSNCANSVFSEQGVVLLPGTSMNLGLPSFIQQSGSSIPEPALTGPERLCLDPVEGVDAEFGGGGEPDIDSYFWTIIHEDGTQDIVDFGGPGDEFQNYTHTFRRAGLYDVFLRVDRCGDPDYFTDTLKVLVVAPPPITLRESYTLCVETPVALTAIDGYDPAEGLYDFEWRDAAGFLRGSDNVLVVNEEGIFTVTVRFRAPADADPNFNSCPAVRSAFVGPAFEFEVNPSADEVCYDETLVTFRPDTPLSGQWFYELQGTGNRVLLGEFFELEIRPSRNLPGPGTYTIVFLAEDPLVPGCFIEKAVDLVVHPLPLLDILSFPSSECDVADGSLEITPLFAVSRLEIEGTGIVLTNLSQNVTIPVVNLAPGTYNLFTINEFGCAFVQTATVQNLNPPLDITYTLEKVDEICGPVGGLDGQVILTFAAAGIQGSYRIVRQGDGLTFENSFTTPSVAPFDVVVSVPAGIYAVEVLDTNGCSNPFPGQLEILRKENAEFSIPSQIEACEQFVFRPLSDQNLDFTLRDALGNVIAPQADGSYALSVSGQYTLRGEDPTGVLCPSERTLDLIVSQPVTFTIVGPRVENCGQGLFYEAQVASGVDPATLLFIWRDSTGNVVGREQRFFPREIGSYSLEVQRRNSSLCADNVLPFEVEYVTSQRALSFEIDAGCPREDILDTFALLILDDPRAEQLSGFIQFTEWFRVVNGLEILIERQNGFLQAIPVEESGLYRVRLTDTFGCLFGIADIPLQLSEIVPPVLKETYVICALEGKTETISVGEYDFYEWTKDGELVSTDSTFTPQQPGNYKLRVSDQLGCFFEKDFVVEENCALEVRFPNAMVLGNNDKNFVVYTNEFVDKLEVFIYNRWGELIFFCSPGIGSAEQPVCPWDGRVNGQFVPIGTYPVVVIAYSSRQGVSKTFKQPLIVLQ